MEVIEPAGVADATPFSLTGPMPIRATPPLRKHGMGRSASFVGSPRRQWYCPPCRCREGPLIVTAPPRSSRFLAEVLLEQDVLGGPVHRNQTGSHWVSTEPFQARHP
jgi:hypothetical protein